MSRTHRPAQPPRFGMASTTTGGWRTGSSPLPPSSWRSGRRGARGGGGRRNQLIPGSQLTPGWTGPSCRNSPRSSGRSHTPAGSCWQKGEFIRSVSRDFVELNPFKDIGTTRKGLCKCKVSAYITLYRPVLTWKGGGIMKRNFGGKIRWTLSTSNSL